MAKSKKMMGRQMPQQAMMAMPMASNSMDRRLSMDADELEMDDAVAVTTATAGVTSSGTGTATFEIEHPSTIEADSKEHKVTITVMELEPNFEYFCTPALNNKVRYSVHWCIPSESVACCASARAFSHRNDGTYIAPSTLRACLLVYHDI